MILTLFIAKVFLSSGILFGYYWLFLRNRQFHQYNRFYLLLSLIIPVIIPFINIPVLMIQDKPNANIVYKAIEVITISSTQPQAAAYVKEGPIQWASSENILMVLYGIGILILLFILLRSLSYIRSISKRYSCEYVDSLKFYNTKEPGTPFSFFNSVFWNEELNLKTPEGKQIFRHEFFHIKQRHSADILLAELIIAFLWLNPFFHLIKKELKAIHEFLADEFASSGTDKYSYAELLVCQSINAKKMSVAQPFFHTNIKRRIAMITSFKNKDYSYASRLLVLPVAFLLFCAFTFYTKKLPDDNIKFVPVEKQDAPLQDTSKPKSTKPKDDPMEKTFVKVEIESAYPGGAAAWLRFLQKTLVYPKEAVEKKIEGMVVVQFIVDREGHISDITVRQGPEELREEAMRVIRESKTWIPGVVRGKTVKSYRLQPVNFRLKNSDGTAFKYFEEGKPDGYYDGDPGKLYREEKRAPAKNESPEVYKSDPDNLYKDDAARLHKDGQFKYYKDEPGKAILPKPIKDSKGNYQSDNNEPGKVADPYFNYNENKNKTAPEKKQKTSPQYFKYEWESNKNTSVNPAIKNARTTPFKYEKEPTKSTDKKPGKKYSIEPIEKTYNRDAPSEPE